MEVINPGNVLRVLPVSPRCLISVVYWQAVRSPLFTSKTSLVSGAIDSPRLTWSSSQNVLPFDPDPDREPELQSHGSATRNEILSTWLWIHITPVWCVLWLRMEETASRYEA
jgi:hypothetical protein